MSCFGFSSKRSTKRVTIPHGLEPASLGVPVLARPHQQFEIARADLSGQHAFHCHVYQYYELQLATRNFSNCNLVGEGGFGRVYKGRLADGTLVAVKRLDRHGLQGDLEFNVEVSIMAGLHHPNVLPLVGSCCEADQRVAVFDYMPHGNLRELLDGKTPAARHFNWPARLNVLLGVAKALQYLHHAATPAIVHRDLKSSNILIDAVGQARICDFGLARHKSLPQNSPTAAFPADSVMNGTYGYMAPEYAASGQITDKSDMYAFGVVVLEMMTGMQAVDARRPQGCETLPHLLQPAMQAVQLMQGNLDPALKRHAPLPAAQLAALCEVAASCLNPRPCDRPAAFFVVTYLHKLLKSTDSALASASGRHARTVSSPPSEPSQPPVSGTPPDLLQQGPKRTDSSFGVHQRQYQQQHQQRHRPAQSMPHLTHNFGVEEDTADSAHSPLSHGHDLRSSAGYGNELGVPGPSRHLTPLAQGLRSASLCSLPAAAAAAAVATSAAPAPVVDYRTLLDPPVAQEGTRGWDSLPSAHSSPVATEQTCPDSDRPVAVMQLGAGHQSPTGHPRAMARPPCLAEQDLRDSAWGYGVAPLQLPSAPPLPRSPSVLLADPPYPQHHAGRQGDGHRPTQSMLPAYHHSHAAHAHTLSFPIQDQTLHQLVRSRTLRDPLGSPTCLEGSPQGSTQPHPPHEGRLKAGKPQQAASPKLSKRQSGNPFASDNSAQGVDTDLEQQGSSSLSHVVSGNPFVTMSEMSWEGSRLVSRQDEAAGEVCAGQSPVASRLNGMLCLEAVQERGVIAGSSVQEHAQPSNQQALPRCVGSSAQLAASANPLKDPEMSPLQNGLIRAWPSPCKVQPPEVMASSWHHFLSASNHPEAAGAARESKAGSADRSPAPAVVPARVGVCLVCLDASRDWQMVPCGHAAACKTCAQQLQQHELPCPVCRAPVTGLCYRQFQQTFVGSAASSNDCKHQRQQAF